MDKTSLQSFICDSPLGKLHHRTLLAIHPYPNLIAGLYSRSTLGQISLQDFTRDSSLVQLICPWPIRDLLVYPCTLGFFRSRWASPLCFNLVVVTNLSRLHIISIRDHSHDLLIWSWHITYKLHPNIKLSLIPTSASSLPCYDYIRVPHLSYNYYIFLLLRHALSIN